MACSCLTCSIRRAIHEHADAVDRAAPKPGGPAIDAIEALTSLSDVIGALLAVHPEGRTREKAMRLVSEVISAAVEAHTTGVPQTVIVGGNAQAVH